MIRLACRLFVLSTLVCLALAAGVVIVGQHLPGGVLAYELIAASGSQDIYMMDLARRITINVTRTPYANESEPVWSPDGTRIVYQRVAEGAPQLCVLGRRLLCYAAAGMWDYAPRWSPDGTHIVFPSTNGLLFVRDMLSGALNFAVEDSTSFDPTWSPDGSQIAFVQALPNTFAHNLYIARADLSDAHPVDTAEVEVLSAAWSPDGTRLAFVGANGLLQNLYVIAPDGTGLRQLTRGGYDSEPTWSPDGSRIAFASQRNGDLDLYLIDADGSDERRLTNNRALDDLPAWSPDGSMLAFSSDRNGDVQIYVMDVQSGSTEQVTFDLGTHVEPVWRP